MSLALQTCEDGSPWLKEDFPEREKFIDWMVLTSKEQYISGYISYIIVVEKEYDCVCGKGGGELTSSVDLFIEIQRLLSLQGQ